MASPDSPPVEPPDTEGEGLLETIGAQLATLAAQVSEIDQRMSSVESGGPSQPVEVRLSPETVAQIAEALAALQAAGSQALDDAFKSATDDLIESLSKLVTSEISRTLTDAGYDVAVNEASEPLADAETVDDVLPDTEPAAAPVRSAPESAAMPAIVAPLTSGAAERVDSAYDAIRQAGAEDDSDLDADESEDAAAEISSDAPPLTLEELDDPFLDALIRKEPLSA